VVEAEKAEKVVVMAVGESGLVAGRAAGAQV
jgi:hypothetical protein